MVTEKDTAMLNELKETLDEVKENNKAVLFAESAQAFRTENLSFQDITASIMEQTEDLFALTRTCDRFSPDYLKLCKTLIRSVDHLGSAFITKVAMVEKKYPVEKIRILSAERLYQMISYNFRKTEDALNTIKKTKQEFDLTLYNQLLTFANVLTRIRVTHKKAVNVSYWYKDPYQYMDSAIVFEPDYMSRRRARNECINAPFRETPSYQLRTDVLTEIAAGQQPETAAAEIIEEPAEQTVTAAEEESVIEGSFTYPEKEAEAHQSVSDGNIPQPEEHISSKQEINEEDQIIAYGEISYKDVMKEAAARSTAAGESKTIYSLRDIAFMMMDEAFHRDEPALTQEFNRILEYAESIGYTDFDTPFIETG